MTTVSIKPGASDPLVMRPSVMATAAELRIDSGTACIVVAGVVAADTFTFDLNALVLTPRLYPVSIYFDHGTGMKKSGEFNLLIEGGC